MSSPALRPRSNLCATSPFYSPPGRWQAAIAWKVRLRYRPRMPKRATTDHGEIIHFAGRLHLFPVALRTDPLRVRLASRDDVKEDEVRVGWAVYFRPFIDARLVFVYDESGGQAVTRAEAAAAAEDGPAGPAGAASTAPGPDRPA